MKNKVKQLCILMAFSLAALTGKAQMSGPYAIPGDFASLAVAVGSLNTVGVSGAVVINIQAGYTETVAVGGLTLNAITGASSGNTITFQKSGGGANPILYAYAGGNATPSSVIQDGIWIFNGADYITVDGIDLVDPNTSNPATMEFGFGFFKASTTDGCQNNTIRNCHITLNRVNNAAGSGPAVDGSRGIDVVNALYTAHTTAVTVAGAAGANSNNRFYSNTIENCNIGIALIGYADSTPFTNADSGNDIGGTSSATGNTIINFGGGGTTSAAAGVRTLAQYGVNVGFNTINSNNGSGVDHAQVLRGIYLNTATSANATVQSNTVTVKGGGTTNQVTAIENASGSTAANNTISIINNLVTNCTYGTATSGGFYGIYNTSSAANVAINNNAFSTNASAATSGNNYMIYNTGGVTNSLTINGNSINGISYTAGSTSLVHRTIYNTGAATTCTMSINSNSIQAITFTGAGSGAVDFINNSPSSATAIDQSISNNAFINLSINTSGNMYLINCNNTSAANGIKRINGNTIVTGFSKTLSGGTVIGYYNFSTSPVTVTEININNNFSNINVVGSTALTVWQCADGPATTPFGPSKTVSNNTFTNIVAGTGQVLGMYVGYSNVNAPGTVSNNVISSLSFSGTAAGIYLNNGSHRVFGNTISSFTTAGATSLLVGIIVNAGTDHNIYKNRVYDLSNTAADGQVVGIALPAGTTNNIYNNLVSDLRTPNALSPNSLAGINITGGTTANVYYNTVYLNATSTGAHFGTSALNVNATPTTIDVRNNIFVNLSTPTGTGLTVAYRRVSTVIANYATTSNNNLYYVGTPSASRLLYHDGTNAMQNLQLLKMLLTPREALSVTENPTFQSLLGSNANFLNINTTTPTQIEAGAAPIPTYLDDYAGTVRNVATPDIGAWEGGFTLLTCTGANGGVLAVTAATACAGQTLVALSNGASIGVGSSYLWRVGVTPGGPYLPVSGGTGSNTTAYTSPTLAAGVYYVVMQASCAATSQSAVSNEGTLTVNAIPSVTASAVSMNLCAGESLSLTSLGSATTFTWTGPNNFTSSSQNPVIASANPTVSGGYSVAVSANNCNSAPSSVNILVRPYPQTPTLSVSSATICPGGAQPLSALGILAGVSPTLAFGVQANQNSASTGAAAYPAPYMLYYGGQRMQILILASELYAAGFVAGSQITSVQFPVVSKGSNWGTTTNENQNFQVSVGHTTLTSIANFQTGLTNVVAPMNFTPVVGYSNTHTFSAPFTWNGANNLVLETTFSNNNSPGNNDVVIQYNSPTSFQSTIVYRADSQTAPVVAAATTTNFAYSARPDFRLNGNAIGTNTWNPAAGLSATTGPSVTATPTTNTTYTFTSAYGSCASNASVSINVIVTPTLNIASTSTALCAGDAATLTVTGADSYSLGATSGTNTFVISPTATNIYTVQGQNQNCPVVTETISIVSNTLPVIGISASSSSICAGQAATLTASGASTYVWVSGPQTSTYAISPTTNSSYSVTGTSPEGCMDQAVVSITVEAAPSLTITPSSAVVCAMTPVSFTASGASTYSWTSGSAVASATVTPSTTGNYVVTGTNSAGCSASKTVVVTVNALPAVAITPASPTICTTESLVLTGSGATTYSWLTAGSITTSTLEVGPASTTSYTLEGTDANNCKNTMSVTVIVDACTGLEENVLSGNVSLFPNPSTGMITTSFGFEGSKEILVLNSVGAMVMKATTEDTTATFDLSGYAKGVYFVRVSTKGVSANYKIIIQ